MFIYKITNQINQKSYIGYNSAEKDTRWRDHTRDYLKGAQSNKLLYRAMKKYRIENFLYERIEENIVSIEILKEREIFWIDYYRSYGDFGYNMTIGGDGGCGNKTFLDTASTEDLIEYKQKLSKSKIDFFTKEKRKEWSVKATDLNLIQYLIAGRANGRKKWWNSLTDTEKSSYQSIRSTGWWDKLTVEEQTEMSANRSKTSIEYHKNLSIADKHSRIQNQKDKISRKCKITSPDKQITVTSKLKEFCKSINVSYTSANISIKEKKTVKGWLFEILEEPKWRLEKV